MMIIIEVYNNTLFYCSHEKYSMKLIINLQIFVFVIKLTIFETNELVFIDRYYQSIEVSMAIYWYNSKWQKASLTTT